MKEKYKSSRSRSAAYVARISVYCREVERETETNVTFEDQPRNRQVIFTIRSNSQDSDVRKAVEYIQGEFVPRQASQLSEYPD